MTTAASVSSWAVGGTVGAATAAGAGMGEDALCVVERAAGLETRAGGRANAPEEEAEEEEEAARAGAGAVCRKGLPGGGRRRSWRREKKGSETENWLDGAVITPVIGIAISLANVKPPPFVSQWQVLSSTLGAATATTTTKWAGVMGAGRKLQTATTSPA